jgi:FAD synthetase
MRQGPPIKHKKVLVFGVFDMLHPGHRWFLSQAKKLGPKLYVIVARDKNVDKQKSHQPQQTEKVRLKSIRALPYVTRAQLGALNLKKRYDVIIKINPDIICLGYDQKYLTRNLKADLKRFGLKTKVIRLGAYKPHLYKSSLMVNKVKATS